MIDQLKTVALELDGPEAHAAAAAFALYEEALAKDLVLGGVAGDMAAAMRPIAKRVTRKLYEAMYGDAEPAMPTPVGDIIDDLVAKGALPDYCDRPVFLERFDAPAGAGDEVEAFRG